MTITADQSCRIVPKNETAFPLCWATDSLWHWKTVSQYILSDGRDASPNLLCQFYGLQCRHHEPAVIYIIICTKIRGSSCTVWLIALLLISTVWKYFWQYWPLLFSNLMLSVWQLEGYLVWKMSCSISSQKFTCGKHGLNWSTGSEMNIKWISNFIWL